MRERAKSNSKNWKRWPGDTSEPCQSKPLVGRNDKRQYKQENPNTMKSRTRAVLIMLCLTLLLSLCACTEPEKPSDIYIYFTGDAHGADDENIGYAGVKALVDATRQQKTRYVTLVDTGDAVWGDFLCNNSEGEYIVGLMNEVGYDYAVLGNHEFDYGMEQLGSLIELANAEYLGCNITYTGSGENPLSALAPYAIESYGETKVAFVGVTTPESITDSEPASFQENGAFVFDFGQADSEAFYATVQAEINAAKEAGADFVILLTHLGDGEEYGEFSSEALIAATSGADAVLDGHAHNEIPCRLLANKDGRSIPLSSTGTGLQKVGQLVITASGNVTVTLLNGEPGRNTAIDDKIAAENAKYESILSEVIGSTAFDLPTHNGDGERIVRNQETALGNLCADAYRASTGADLAFINGGGLRAPLKAGEITFGDIMALHPYGNNICVVKATGAEIADALEFAARNSSLGSDGLPVGEDGGFLHVSGLKFTIDTAIASTVTTDENGMFVSVGDARRVSDILVETMSGYLPLDRSKTYTVASFNYTLQQCGDGYSMFADNEYAVSLGKFDYETLIEYIRSFEGGRVPIQYASTEGRITIK